MKKFLLGCLGLVVFVGCATLRESSWDWIPVGPDLPATKVENLEIVSSRKDITHPYGVLGMLRIKNVKPDRESLLMGLKKGKEIAASKGADAITVGQYNSAADGATDPKVTIIIYAIKYVDQLTPADEEAIEKFEELEMLNEHSNS